MPRKRRTPASKRIAETDLYRPIYEHLVAQGYTVRSEVEHCDITATRGDELVVVELKRSFGTNLLVQATQRQKVADSVYVALPRPDEWNQAWGRKLHLLKRLELGLILVSFDSGEPIVEVVFHPVPFDRRQRKSARRAVLQEIESRSGDFNEGGSYRRKIATAYRENAIHIACCLDVFGPLSPRQLRSLGTGPKTGSILYSDVYGWFDRIGRGLYGLRPQGRTEIGHYPRLARRYRTLARERSSLLLPTAEPKSSPQPE
ncbi:MAG: hypothetical protein JSV65_14825 [Armatimonadota bacterium]|nr:MAG: hypothetical protein JSV65_14825 [Armatimonadota bacterium]